jgi:membrane fusion protein (multidrug efflux system)
VSTPDPQPADEAASSSEAAGSSRRRGLAIIALCVLLGAAAWSAYWYAYARWRVSTDDAYVGGTIIQVTSDVAGTILSVHARETDTVNAGQTLLELDPADARVAMDAAVADLGNTVRQVRGAFVQVDRLRAQVTLREVELARARQDLARRNSLAEGGAVSAEDVAHARDAVAGLEAALRAAREELNVALAQTAGTTPAEHPQVLRAAGRVREASLALQRTVVKAPVRGVIAKKGVQVGQRVAPGAPLLGLVPLEDVWVDANFKEVQLGQMRIGQPVSLHADMYGNDVEFLGRIRGFSPGTGAAFALLPPQNASGNWIKIVQRVPVRIALDPAQVREHPLRIGLSVRAVVDVHDQTGPVLTEPRKEETAAIQPRTGADPATEALIARTIAANSGQPAP